MPMLEQLQRLSSAEEFFHFFNLDYEQSVLNVSRLHILKRFNQYLARETFAGLPEAQQLARGRTLLARAYSDFLSTTAQEAKLFKVFQDAAGLQQVGIDKLRATLPSRASA